MFGRPGMLGKAGSPGIDGSVNVGNVVEVEVFSFGNTVVVVVVVSPPGTVVVVVVSSVVVVVVVVVSGTVVVVLEDVVVSVGSSSHPELKIVLLSSVTAEFREMRRPSTVAP